MDVPNARSGEAEEELLRSVALQNAQSILLARQRAEQELLSAKEALEAKTAALAYSLAMMRATLESTTDGILVVSHDGRVSDCNEQFMEMWRLPREAVESQDHERLLQSVAADVKDPERFRATLDEIYRTSPGETYDLIELADGRVFERSSKVQVVDGRTVGRVWSFRDTTERRRTDEELRRAAEERKILLENERAARAEAERTSELKDQFLATLSHELRTPLSAILGWSQVLRMRAMGEAELHQGLATIERNARVQAQLIEDLLDMSRITSGKVRLDIQPMAPLSVIEAAIETVRPAADAKGIRLEKSLDPAAGSISGDPSRLQQVVWNLLANAIKFTPKDGRVQVLLERVSSNVEISVVDTGIGIKPNFLPYVFERFRQEDASTTRKYGGLGLGLSIVRHLVELHGGTVHAASAGEGKGTTFRVHLPVTADPCSGSAEGSLPAMTIGKTFSIGFTPTDLSGVKLLVVDDEKDARDLIERVLVECHAQVLTATSAEEALRLVEQWKPDVLVSDVGMPQLDGYGLLRRVRALGQAQAKAIPAIALTAYARPEDRARSLRAGFLVHLSKPVEPAELVASVASVVGRAGGG